MWQADSRSNLLGLVTDSDSEDGLALSFVATTSSATTKHRLGKSAAEAVAAKHPIMPPRKQARGRGGRAAATTGKNNNTKNKITKPAPKKKAALSSARRSSGRLAAAAAAATDADEADEADEADALNPAVRDALAEMSSNARPRAAAAAPAPGRKGANAGAGAKGRGGKKAQPARQQQEEEAMAEDSIMDEAPEPASLATPPASDPVTTAPTRTRGARGRAKKATGATGQAGDVLVEVPDSTAATRRITAAPGPSSATNKRGRRPPAAGGRKVEIEIPETQEETAEEEAEGQDAMQIDMEGEDGDTPERLDAPRSSRPVSALTRPASSDNRQPSSPAKQAADSGGGGDPALRRRLGEMTRKYESLEARHRDLREIGVQEAERNFDRLKKQAEERLSTANQLIASLKSELATQREAAAKAHRTQEQLEASGARADGLQAQVTDLTTALSQAKTEAKALGLKLAAARHTAEAVRPSAVPGSAMKGGGNGARGGLGGGMMGSGPGGSGPGMMMGGGKSGADQATQMKLDLYDDLTGLIITGVKRDGAEDVFDCLQTGRNGTLHFKLIVAHEEAYDDAQFTYMPQLEQVRDNALIAVLPGFLVEEITFPRPQVSKFYARVMKALMEKPE